MKNFLDNWRRQRDANRLAGGMEGAQEYMRRKAMVDNAPVGAVGAPSGIAEHQNALGGDALTNLGALGSFAPVIGDAVGLATDARYLYMNPEERTPLNYGLTAMGALPFVPAMSAMTAFHGSPHKFDVFDMKKVGTGEGAQAYGHGLYFAENPKVAENYADQVPLSEVKRNFLDTLPEDAEFEELLDLIGTKTFSEQQEQVIQALAADDWLGFDYPSQAISAAYSKNLKNWDPSPALIEAVSGSKNLYEVDIPDAAIDKMLDWNKPLREQPESVQKAMGDLWPDPAMTGGEAYTRLARMPGFVGDARRTQGIDGAYSSQNIVSQRLNDELGIPGIKYFDSGSRAASEGTRNFVVFDDKLPTVLKRNDESINALDMGHDARMARAREMGFDVHDELYHGSTHDIERFDVDRTNADNYYGKGIYLTDSYDDANINYAGVGPDLTNRIEVRTDELQDMLLDKFMEDGRKEVLQQLYDETGDLRYISAQVADMDDNDAAREAAHQLARLDMKGSNEGVVYPMYASNEGVINESDSFIDLDDKLRPWDEYKTEAIEELGADAEDYEIEDFARELEDADMVGIMDDINSALNPLHDAGYEEAAQGIAHSLYENRGLSLDDIVRVLDEYGVFIEDFDGGLMTNRAIAAEIAKEFGVKGVRMDAGKAFPKMDGTLGARHTILFDPSLVRSTNAAFNPAEKHSTNILASTLPLGVGLGVASQLYRPSSQDEI